MSPSPSTPDKAGMHATGPSFKAPVSYTDKLASSAKGKQAALEEPSPASTYGDTVAGSSPPATPQDHQDGGSNGLMRSLQATHMDPAVETISGSPMTSHGGKYFPRTQLHGDRGFFGEAHSSPSKNSSTGNLDGNGCIVSSPTTNRVKEIRESPNWRTKQEIFVRQSGTHGSDPFVSNDNARHSQGNNSPFSPRQDRIGVPISSDNAQGVLLPSACVFVANLVQTQTDDQLEHHVQLAFSEFGTCYVKIRRDERGMPYSFVQFDASESRGKSDADHAQRAITMGRGMLINGRPCRTEVAKVNRAVYISKVTGGPVSETEARDAMARYGPIQKVWECTQTEKEMYRLPDGIWVRFAYFGDCRDAQAGTRDHPVYRLEQPPMRDDVRARQGGRLYHPMSPMQRRSPGGALRSPQSASRRAVADMRSIFVGNLPSDVTEALLFDMFLMFGTILHIDIVQKPSADPSGTNAFAFIEYATSDMATLAVQASPRVCGTGRLRVERKESTEPLTLRGRFHGSPRNPYYADPHEMAMLFQRGVSIGMTQAAQAHTIPPPVYAPYAYYQQYDPSHYGQLPAPVAPVNNNNTIPPGSLQSHGNGYLAQAMGQFQYSQAPAPLYQYTQPQTRPTYQWPPNANVDSDNASPTLGTQ